MHISIDVLFVSDSEEDVQRIQKEMKGWGFFAVAERVDTFKRLYVRLKTKKWDLIISDYAVGQLTYTEILSLIECMEYELPVIVFSDHNDEKDMLEAIEKGCSDYIIKNDMSRLRLAVCRTLKETAVCNGHKKIMREYFLDNKRLMDTLDSIGDGVITTDKYGNVILINKVAQAYTGWGQQEALGKPLNSVFHIIDKVSRVPAENPFDKVLREGVPTGLKSNTVLVAKDNTEKYVSASCSPIITGNKFTGAILVFRDITRIKQAEEKIVNEEKNLNSMFDAAPVGMVLLDRNIIVKKANGKILHMSGNSTFKQITNKKIGEIFNCPYGCNYEKDCGYRVECENCGLNSALRKACGSEEAIVNEEVQYTVHKKGSNTKLWLRINSVPVVIDGERHTLVVIDDITEFKQLQEELKGSNLELQNALEELKLTQNQLIQQEKLAGIGQLAAGVAHEINNPLGFVMSNFETLRSYIRKYKGVLEEYRNLRDELSNLGDRNIELKISNIDALERKENIEFITKDLEDLFKDTNEGLERIGKIIMGLRLFSRIDQQNDISEYDLNEGIKNTLIVAYNEIKYYADVEQNLQDIPTVHANGGQINQVLLNIIVNAVHAIRLNDAGKVGLIKISTGCDDKYIYCRIEDNGVGIAEENLNRIFEPFFTTKPVGKGTGLGLSISYDIIVNKHGGELLVDSVQGVGSSFTIKLPIKQQKIIS